MKLVRGVLILILTALSTYVAIKWLPKLSDPFGDVKSVTWGDLVALNYHTGEAPVELKDLIRADIKIAGFVVPLTDNFSEIREFLLVPDAMSCIHVPPPPPNQMILVKLEKPAKPQLAYGPVWVMGKINIQAVQSDFGVVSYQMQATHIKIYEDLSWKGN